MKIKKVWAVCFSPTGNTAKIAEAAASAAAEEIREVPEFLDITLPQARAKNLSFGAGDLVVIGVPTYAGRVPNKIMPFIRDGISGKGAVGVPVVTYGNRSADDSLMELYLLMRDAGFHVPGGGVFVCQHAFAHSLAANRPDREDREKARELGREALLKAEADCLCEVHFPGRSPVGPYYVPKGVDGNSAVFLKARPKRDASRCTACGTCAKCCPMGSIGEDFETAAICIKCQACIRKCPAQARFFDDAAFLSHKAMLEQSCRSVCRNSEIYL